MGTVESIHKRRDEEVVSGGTACSNEPHIESVQK